MYVPRRYARDMHCETCIANLYHIGNDLRWGPMAWFTRSSGCARRGFAAIEFNLSWRETADVWSPALAVSMCRAWR
jgi:hypothetical protein